MRRRDFQSSLTCPGETSCYPTRVKVVVFASMVSNQVLDLTKGGNQHKTTINVVAVCTRHIVVQKCKWGVGSPICPSDKRYSETASGFTKQRINV